MCGGSIISKIVVENRGQKPTTTEELWSELDAFSDLLAFDSNANTDLTEENLSPMHNQVPAGSHKYN